jgi:hypothetical protein
LPDVDPTPSFSMKEAEQRGGVIGRWPLLARLPDVSEALPATERTSQSPSAEALGYRIDPPQVAGVRHNTIRATVAGAPAPSHILLRHPRIERQARPQQRTSTVLPESNPFSIPRAGLIDTIAPVVRFVTLVVLFAAAGTWFQLIARRNAPATELNAPAKASGPQSQRLLDAPREKSATGSTAAGPLGALPQKTSGNGADSPTAVANTTSRVVVAAKTALAAGNVDSLPQVRIAERGEAGTTEQ